MPDKNVKTKRVTKGSSHASKETRREQLLDAAISCFGEFGYHGTTIDSIAAEAGLSKGSVYRFFKSKDELLFAILDSWESKRETSFENDWSKKSPLEQLRQICRASAYQMAEHRSLLGVWFDFFRHEEAKARMRQTHHAWRKKLSNIIRKGIADGSIKDVSATKAADSILAMLEGFFVMAFVDEEFQMKRRFDAMWTFWESTLLCNEQI